MITYKVTVNEDGDIFWRNEVGERHREDGPAIEGASGYKAWYLNDQRHREDGPAVEYSDGTKFWYLNGVRMTEKEHARATSPTKELSVIEIENLLGYKVKVIKE